MRLTDAVIASVNLTTERKSIRPAEPLLRRFPGGRALNQYLLISEIAPGTGAFDVDNVLAIGAGLLTGSPYPGAVRLSVDSINAFTGGIGSSNCGGGFGSEMKRAGFAHLMLKGRSAQPVYLWLHNGVIEIRDATHIWGKGVYETDALLKHEVEDAHAHVLCIGPAGENLVRSACIMVDRDRALARCGLGAVLGSKRVKAVVVRGTNRFDLHDWPRFRTTAREARNMLKDDSFNSLREKYGVYCYAPWIDESPYHNFQGGLVPSDSDTEQVTPEAFLNYKTASKGCEGCPIRCWATHEAQSEAGGVIRAEALQGNDPHNFGAKLGIFDTRAILALHTLCNDLGLDQDNLCGVLSWAFECYQRGILDRSMTDGLVLDWGNLSAVEELIRKITCRQGLGDILAEGSLRAARILGGEEYSIHIKGQELQEIMRTRIGWALGTAVSARGGTHTRGAVQEGRIANTPPELARRLFGLERVGAAEEYTGKERLVCFYERLQAMCDSLGICYFTNSGRTDFLMPQHFIEALDSAIGWRITEEEFVLLAERTHCLEKAFNVLHRGWGRDHDLPPARFFDEPVVNGPRAGAHLDRTKWKDLLDRYYALHGWDLATGWPTEETLCRLDLGDVAELLKKWHRLP